MCKALKGELYENRGHTQDTTTCKQVACKKPKKKKKDATNMKIEHGSSYCSRHQPHNKHVRQILWFHPLQCKICDVHCDYVLH